MEQQFKKVTAQELKKWLDQEKDVAIFDVLSSESYAAQHVPESISAPAKEADFLEQVARHVENKNAPVVVYCASESCQLSPAAAQKLVDAGYAEVYDFKGGLAEWQEAGYPLEESEEK